MERWPLPEGWEWRTLAEVCEINPRRPTIERDDDAPTSFVPMAAVDEVEGRFAEVQVRPYREVKRGYTYFEDNDVVFAKITPCMENGKAAIAQDMLDGFGFGTTEFHVLRPKPGVLPEWIHRYVRQLSFRQEARKHFRGAVGQQRVPQEFLESSPIPLPHPDDPARSLETQRRIVARLETMLSEVRAMRDLLQSMRRDWAALIESALAEVFPSHGQALPEGWEWKTIPDVCSINPKRPRIKRDDETPTSFVPMQAVDERTGTIADMQTRPYGEVRRGYTYFEENDVLMAKITPSMENGKAAIARNLIDGIGFGTTEFHVFHPHPNILPEWIFYFIRRKTFRERAKMSFRGAVGQQRVPEDFLVNQEIPVPYPDDPARSLAEQRRIAAYLEAVQGEVSAARRQVEEDERRVTQLEQSILAAAFRGES